MKKIIAIILAAMMLLTLAACQTAEQPGTQPADQTGTQPAGDQAQQKFVIGICQFLPHPALDKATEGFKAAVIAELGEENVTFDEQNAAGDSNTCATIVNGFVAAEVDLIMANATPALQAAAAATAGGVGIKGRVAIIIGFVVFAVISAMNIQKQED